MIGFSYSCMYLYKGNTSDTSDAVWISEYRIDCDPPATMDNQFNAVLVDFYLVWGSNGFEINENAINGKSRTNKQTNKQTDQQTYELTDKQTNKQTSELTNKQTNKQTTNKQTNKQLHIPYV